MSFGNLIGNYWVRLSGSVFHDARRWLPKTSDMARLRRHALNLRFFPEHHPIEPSGLVFDLDWSIVQGLPDLKIYELRIHEAIGGCDNLRVIFHVGPPDKRFPMTCIWVLAVFQKKRDDFTPGQIRQFRNRRLLVHERFYN